MGAYLYCRDAWVKWRVRAAHARSRRFIPGAEIDPLDSAPGFWVPYTVRRTGIFMQPVRGPPRFPILTTETDDMNLYGLLLVLLGVLPVLLIGRGGFRGVPVASR